MKFSNGSVITIKICIAGHQKMIDGEIKGYCENSTESSFNHCKQLTQIADFSLIS